MPHKEAIGVGEVGPMTTAVALNTSYVGDVYGVAANSWSESVVNWKCRADGQHHLPFLRSSQ